MKDCAVVFFQEFLSSILMFATFFGGSVFFRNEHYMYWFIAHFLLVVGFDYITVRSSVNPAINIAVYLAGRSPLSSTMSAVSAHICGGLLGFSLVESYLGNEIYSMISCMSVPTDLYWAALVEMLCTFGFSLEIFSSSYIFGPDRLSFISVLALALRSFMILGTQYGVNVAMNPMVGLGCLMKDVPVELWLERLNSGSHFIVVYILASLIGVMLAAIIWYPLQVRHRTQKARSMLLCNAISPLPCRLVKIYFLYTCMLWGWFV